LGARLTELREAYDAKPRRAEMIDRYNKVVWAAEMTFKELP
jgi:hypothetical protein